ncbi:MAG TPA: hypothetical protein VH080_08640, partial [Gemmatimonadaceae bacterium]|nr:hypothetical protein [Gemmatimonadaceae bacterium]
MAAASGCRARRGREVPSTSRCRSSRRNASCAYRALRSPASTRSRMRVYLRTFGCRANHYDSETARAMIERAGHGIVSDVREADVAVFNSCAVTAEAEADLRSAVRRAARSHPELRSVVMGCATGLAAQRDDSSLRSLPSVEHLVDGADMDALAMALDLPRDAAVVRAATQTTVRALLRIQDGCDEHCTFCATT